MLSNIKAFDLDQINQKIISTLVKVTGHREKSATLMMKCNPISKALVNIAQLLVHSYSSRIGNNRGNRKFLKDKQDNKCNG